MARLWLSLVGAALVIAPFVATGEAAPQVTFATPGSSGASGGAINRFTMRFSEAMVPLGDPRASAPANVACPIGNTGRWADQQTYIVEFERPLPGGLTCKVDLRSGLKSVRGVYTAGTSSFTIDTGGPSLRAVLPGEYDDDIEEDQIFLVASNIAANPKSIVSGGYCAVEGIGEKIALEVLGTEVATKLLSDLGEDDWNSRNFLESAGLPRTVASDAQARAKTLSTVNAVRCGRPLPPGQDVSLVWGSDIASIDGRQAGRVQRYDFTVRTAFTARFECSRVNPQAGCSPIEDVELRFTAPVRIDLAKEVRLSFADGTTVSPYFAASNKSEATVSDLTFKGPFPAASSARMMLPAGLRDESGRPLANAQRFPLATRFDEAPPLVKFSAAFGILEATEGGILPVTVRAVEASLAQSVTNIGGDALRVSATDGEVAEWLRDVEAADRRDFRTEQQGKETVEVNYTGTKSLLNGRGKSLKLSPPAGGKDFEVVGIPLKDPGFYVVELASPILGKSLLGRPTTRYVSAAALVTNMAVHFKWGREKSLAWVTTLDGAEPVRGADIRVSDSCSGKQIARGTSDKAGRLIVNGLPDPETYAGCGDRNSHPLMISARKSGDFSFTLTDWGKGIAPGDFDLNYGYSAPDDILHTIFDRSLVRQGEVVNMKQILRRPIDAGFALSASVSGTLTLTHSGSGTAFELPISIGGNGSGESSWSVPKGAPLGRYGLDYELGGKIYYTGQSLQVDEYQLPTMRATIAGPKSAAVKPTKLPLNLFVGYFSGGPAANLPVSIRTAYNTSYSTPDGWDGWSFGGSKIDEGTIPLNSDGEEPDAPTPLAQTLPVTLGSDGTAAPSIDIGRVIDTETDMIVEMDYQDANGETLTTSRTIPLLPSAIRLGIKTDGWIMRDSDLRLKFVALDPDNKPVRGKLVSVDIYSREVLTARRRLIGGFYAYDNQMRTKKVGARCTATTDKLGLASCTLNPGVSGEVMVLATTTDADGNVSRAVQTVWLAGEDEWWFGGDNGDRMDVIPEAKSYKAGETAKFQVRMPFREATALVTVEREGVVSSFVTELSGKDPVVEVAMPAAYAPDVYVSVLAVRGRIGGFKLWTAKIARDWSLPFLSRDGYQPSALVDLAKPSYRLGIAKVNVGWDGYQLGVKVTADKKRFAVRETANVDIVVTEPDGKPAKSAEVAFAAVDEALLQLSPNDSWNLIDAMMGERPISVLTSTAQTQVVGKRHFGKKAVAAGGGGGDDSGLVRNDFKPVLLWRGKVALDAQGKAKLPVQMADSLSSYRLVAIASSGTNLFGTGEARVRTAQDLTVYSGIPPLVRSGDWFGATFTLRNGTDKPMAVTANVKVSPSVATGKPLTVTIPAGGSAPVTWNLTAPENVGALNWQVEAKAAGTKASDIIEVVQSVIPAVPVEIWAGTLVRIGANTSIPMVAPTGAISGLGYVDVKLSDTLAPPLAGVRDYMRSYPYSCFEQQTSRFVVMNDGAGWDSLAIEIPAFLDSDGLLRYWPDSSMRGSVALTAYVLSITAEAGFVIPAEPKSKMIEAMKAVVNGKLKRDYAWASNDRLTRLDALAALARNRESTPAMLGSMGLAPADMTTATLADWLTTIDRTPGAESGLRTQAETILRQRLVYEGARLDLTDKDSAAWWMMSSSDEMAIKAFLAALGRPGWSEDDGRMMVGIALRQSHGHWDTTLANAWGSIAARKFASRYPATAVTGMTTLSLGNETKAISWPTSSPDPVRLALPLAKSALVLRQSDGAGPWATVSLAAAVPLTQPLNAGYRIEKSIEAVSRAKSGQWTRGDVVKVKIIVNALAGRNWVVVNDPLPPGATVVGSLGGQSQLLAGAAQNEGASPSYVERGNDSWRGFFEWAPEGKFSVEYVMRLNGVGQFTLPPTKVEAMYSPSIRGAFPNRPITVALQ